MLAFDTSFLDVSLDPVTQVSSQKLSENTPEITANDVPETGFITGTNNPISLKRNCSEISADSTSSETIALKPSFKTARTKSPSKHKTNVSFLLQNNNDAAESDTTNQAAANNQGGAGSNNNNLLSTYKVNLMALPMWRSARNNRIAEKKAGLRADVLQDLLSQDIVPGTFLGADKLPAYLLPLSNAMTTLIREQGGCSSQPGHPGLERPPGNSQKAGY